MHSEGFYTAEDGVEIWYGETGNLKGPTLVLCDGIACDGFIWPHIIDAFSPTMRIVRWHYRGHGRSSAPNDDDRLRLEVLCDDLAGILGHLDAGPAIVAGHSMGVQIALEFYRQYPKSVRGIVLMCGSYGKPLSTFQGTDLGERLLPLIRSTVTRLPRLTAAVWSRMIPTEIAFQIARTTEIHPQRASRAEFMPYLEHVARMDPRVFLGMLSHAAEHTAEDVLDTVQVPALVVAGERDGFTPPELSNEMVERMPKGELFVLAGGTHTAPIEYPEAVEVRLREFFGRIDADVPAAPAASPE